MPFATRPIARLRALSCCFFAGVVVATLALSASPAVADPPTGAIVTDSGCTANSMPRNDDFYAGPISLPFDVNWFGTTYSQLWINNNGGVNLQQAWNSYSGLDLGSINQPVIAPIFTDVDTRNGGTTPVSYGTITYDGHPAFCVDWVNVGHYPSSGPYYSAQLLLVDRSDTDAGNVDAVFNYERVGTSGYPLIAGYAAADGTYYQLPGSQSSPSTMADGGDDALIAGTMNSGGQLGRYTFPVRGGMPPQSQTIDFPNPGTVSVAQQTVALHATATSGLPVSYTASGVCTISGSDAVLTGVGTCSVTAHQSGDVSASPPWNAAPDVTDDFSVTPPPVDITTTVLPNATLGSPYATTTTATGGVAPYTWSITKGALPAGITLDPATGLLAGTPTALGVTAFDLTATDSVAQTDTVTLAITVRQPSSLNARPMAATPDGGGYWVATPDGGVFAFGNAVFHGSLRGASSSPITGIAATPDGGGYWLSTRDGGVFAFGNAVFHGSITGDQGAGIVGMASTSDGGGYWLVAADGGVFAFGDAGYYGSAGGLPLVAPVLGMAATSGNHGYWLVAADGGVFAFGDAEFRGSLGGHPLGSPIVGMAATADDRGYWLVAADGGVDAFGDAGFYGSARKIRLNEPMTGIAATADDRGYWLVAGDGGVFAYGDARFTGSRPGLA